MSEIGVTLWQMAVQGGPVMLPIAALSIFVVALGFYCLFAIRKNAIVPKNFISGLKNEIKVGNLHTAANICHSPTPLICGVLLPGLLKVVNYINYIEKNDSQKNDTTFYTMAFSSIREIIEAEGSRLASRLRQRVVWFSHVGIIAPMFGLLGTVFGMIRAFSSIAYKVEFGKPLLLASAISEAMVTTAGGLTVGIFSMILFFYFHSKTNKIIYDMEADSESIVDAINMATSGLSLPSQTIHSKKDVINMAMNKLSRTPKTTPSKKEHKT
ncbi:MAG: MotA/TolQ/ExbB proton channel family protein [Candidatus Scalinduaceae bacterium]